MSKIDKDSAAYLKEFEMVVNSAYLNNKEGKNMTPEEMEEYKARRNNILTKYSISYEKRHFGKSIVVVRSTK